MRSKSVERLLLSLLAAWSAAAAAARLGDDRVEYLLDDRTGMLVQVRTAAGGRWPGTVEIYELESRRDVERSTETADRVQTLETPAAGRVRYHCVNPLFPGVNIEKTYTFDDGGALTKELRFSAETDDRLVRWISAFEHAEPRLPDDALLRGQLLALAGSAAVELNRGVGQTLLMTRETVNGRTVMRCGAGQRRGNWSRMPVFSEFLQSGAPVSAGIRYRVADTLDYAVLLRQLQQERQAFFDANPAWVGELLADVMYLTNDTAAFAQTCAPRPVTATIWFLNPPWGNWHADSDPPAASHHNVRSIAPEVRSLSPNVRVAAYTCGAYDDASEPFRDHPEQLLKTRDGKLYGSSIISDHAGRPSYYLRLDDPAVRRYLVDMHVERSREWGFGFHYTDGPGFFHELPDWESRRVVQNYHWLDYLKELLDGMRTVDPEAVIFSNGCMPFSAINYVEWRDGQWQTLAGADWRPQAVELLAARLAIPDRNTMVLTYGSAAAEPAFSAYTVFYGGAGHLPMTWRHPYALAALRTRGATPLPGLAEPSWYRDAGVNYEAMLFRQGDALLLNLLGHDGAADTATLRFPAAAAGLEPGKSYRAELLTAAPCVPESDNAGRIAARPFAFPAPCPETVEVTLPVRPMTVVSLKIIPEEI